MRARGDVKLPIVPIVPDDQEIEPVTLVHGFLPIGKRSLHHRAPRNLAASRQLSQRHSEGLR